MYGVRVVCVGDQSIVFSFYNNVSFRAFLVAMSIHFEGRGRDGEGNGEGNKREREKETVRF